MHLNLYAVARAAHGGYTHSGNVATERKGDYLERLPLGHYSAPTLAIVELLRAYEKRKSFHGGRGWHTAPDDLFYELWARRINGAPLQPVIRTSDDTLTAAADFVRDLPGRSLHAAMVQHQRDHRLITGTSPTRTSRLTHVIQPGGQLPAKGA